MDSSRKRSNFSAYSKRTSPAGVSSTDLAERSRSLALYACSSWRICALTADCERKTFWPAREKLFSLATYTKVASWSKSMGEPLDEHYSGIVGPSAAVGVLFSGMNDRLGNLRTVRRDEHRFAWLQPREHRFPGVFDGALEM